MEKGQYGYRTAYKKKRIRSIAIFAVVIGLLDLAFGQGLGLLAAL